MTEGAQGAQGAQGAPTQWEVALVPLPGGRQWVIIHRGTLRVHRWPGWEAATAVGAVGGVMAFADEVGARAEAERLNAAPEEAGA